MHVCVLGRLFKLDLDYKEYHGDPVDGSHDPTKVIFKCMNQILVTSHL